MARASLLRRITASPGALALDMIQDILSNRRLGPHKKLPMLRELRVERISFDSPEQAVKIISGLAEIVSTDSHAEVRATALEAMEHMIDLEGKAEAEQGKPPVDWRRINVMLHKARKNAENDMIPAVASRLAPPKPESMGYRLPKAAPTKNAVSKNPPAKNVTAQVTEAIPPPPEMHPVARKTDDVSPAEAAMLAVQEDAVAAVRRANLPPAPSPEMALAEPEPPIMKFLRAVADTDEEETIRALAKRIIGRIEALTVLKPGPVQTPELNEG